jgi:regulator of protease activity HflC (stomatin/prohibitin superfamily)
MIFVNTVVVEQHEQALLFLNGRLVRSLEPGKHRVWRFLKRMLVVRVDMRLRTIQISGQEVMTADQATVRLNAIVRYRVRNPVAAVTSVQDYESQVYTDVQLALRSAMGGMTLDSMLASKNILGEQVKNAVRAGLNEIGVELVEVGLKDLVLPGEMKVILNQVIEARKRAEAAQIERREEVAATRSLANTAQMLDKNPVLMRLKELEALEKILRHSQQTIVLPDRLLKLFGREENVA